MATDTDLINLYSKRILSLAANIPHSDPLEDAMASASKRSPLCGSNIRVSLNVTDGKISDFSQDVKACALGQAAAAVLGANVIGLTRDDVAKARDQLFNMLTADGPTPDAPFEELEVMQSAKTYRNRHASIMLSYDATLLALDELT